MEELRRALADRKKRESSNVVSAPNLSLEYPLGPASVDSTFLGSYLTSSNAPATLESQHVSGLTFQNTVNTYNSYMSTVNTNAGGYSGGHYDPFLAMVTPDNSVPMVFGTNPSRGSSDGDPYLFDRQRSSISSESEYPSGGHFVPSYNASVAL